MTPRTMLDSARETILLVSEGTGTKASILARIFAKQLGQQYNVVALLVSQGDLVGEFKNCCADLVGPLRNYAEAERAVKQLMNAVPIKYAIASGTRTAMVIRALTTAFVPVVTLVSEFGSAPQSVTAEIDAVDWSTTVVFFDQIVADAATREHPALLSRKTYMLPQEKSCLSDAAVIAPGHSDMDRHVLWLDQLGREAIGVLRQREDDFVTLRDNPLFDSKVFLAHNSAIATRERAIIAFLARWAAVGKSRLPGTNFFLRRPCAGFHPQLYAYENADRYDSALINPLAHLIRSGSPKGPWKSDIITPNISKQAPAGGVGLRIAIHGHFFYPELAADFLKRLACNRTPSDLWLTTDNVAKAALLRDATLAYQGGSVEIRVVPNRGRNIAPFLAALEEIESHYDVVGHIHGKRSPQTLVGEQWRQFLWENLLGHSYPMIDEIHNRFEADKTLGIVFPDDPHLPDWDTNLEIASQLATRIGIKGPLPPYFNFPVGNMFWVRPQALRPLVELKLGWRDYPEEPLPNDGTLLHALERLLPFVAQCAGYRYAVTHIPGITWNGGIDTHDD
jgi:hypothetical protein